MVHALNGKRLRSNDSMRVMPLEAGSAMHQVFAAVRMFDLMNHQMRTQGRIGDDIMAFGAQHFRSREYDARWPEALDVFASQEDDRTRAIQFALHILETSGFHDDPTDTRRTQTNLETAAINYVNKYPLARYIPVVGMGSIRVGIEVPFDVTLYNNDTPLTRFIGKVDAVCMDMERGDPLPEVHENKTGARIDTVWSSAFEVGHQVTGYLAAINTLLDIRMRYATIWGTQIPVPSKGDGHYRSPVERTPTQFGDWARWLLHTLENIERWKDAPTDAPMYTHSCNRYFRACSLIPFCAETPEQRKLVYERDMIVERWNPLEEAE